MSHYVAAQRRPFTRGKKPKKGKPGVQDNLDDIQQGFWLSNQQWATRRHLLPLRRRIAAKKKSGELKPMEPVVKNFKIWVNSHSVYRMWVNSMIAEANAWFDEHQLTLRKSKDDCSDDDEDDDCLNGEGSRPGHDSHSLLYVDDFDEFCELINEVITTAPGFTKLGIVSTPLLGIFFGAMGTKSGIALFHDTLFNQQVKLLLDSWNTYLKSSASCYLLDITKKEQRGSWVSKAAHRAGVWFHMEHDHTKQYYGFDSWNAFFLRQFKSGARPYKGDPDTQICIGCETTPWRYVNDVQMESNFWVKAMPYSLMDLFGGQKQWAKLFEGGQLYQGFLSAMHYHRWRSPLKGKVVRSWVQPGTYFAERPWTEDEIPEGETVEIQGLDTQPYLGHVSARAIFVFKTEKCGYVALICVGMVEVSSCVISPSKFIVEEGGEPVDILPDDEIGRFEFGGSTHIMMFQKDFVQFEDWALEPSQEGVKHLGSVIATATNA